jgi:hypothetical protein
MDDNEIESKAQEIAGVVLRAVSSPAIRHRVIELLAGEETIIINANYRRGTAYLYSDHGFYVANSTFDASTPGFWRRLWNLITGKHVPAAVVMLDNPEAPAARGQVIRSTFIGRGMSFIFRKAK